MTGRHASEEDIQEVWRHFKDFQHVFLATSEGDQPRVRPVTLTYFNDRFWITTGTDNAKVEQIRRNPRIECCRLLRGNDEPEDLFCIRIAGQAEIINDMKKKRLIAEHCDFFSKHWKSVDDPNYTLIEICPSDIEYLRPGETTAQKFKL